MQKLVSISPDGTEYRLPETEEYAHELVRVSELAAATRKNGQEIVVAMGVGIVGAVMEEVKEERDILKKLWASFPGGAGKVPVH